MNAETLTIVQPANTDLADAMVAAAAVADQLNGAFFERTDEVKCLMTALLAGEHVLLLGDPGTGKSALTNAFCKAVAGGTRPFTKLLTKFTTDSEMFGPVSVQGLKADRYERKVDGYFPTAKVAFLDEIFKANSAILNALLTALNERAYDQGSSRMSIPLEIAVGASNELPQDESLGALYDRFVLRRWVNPIQSPTNRRRLMLMAQEPAVTATLSAEQLATLRTARNEVDVDGVIDDLLILLTEIDRQHSIKVSDRRARKAVKLVRSYALLNGRTTAVKADLMILVDALWDQPGDRALIAQTFADVLGPDESMRIRALVDAAVEACTKVPMNATGSAFTKPGGDAGAVVRTVRAELDTIGGQEAEDAKRRVDELFHPVRNRMMELMGL